MVDLIFIHVMKTAGVSFYATLKHAYGDVRASYEYLDGKAIRPARGISLHDTYNATRKAEWATAMAKVGPGVRVLEDHMPVQFYDGLLPEAKRVIWLRDPVHRIISRYVFVWHPEIAYDIYEYIEEDRARNVMTFFTAGGDLSRFFFVGLVERFEDGLARLAGLLKWPVGYPVVCRNTCRNPELKATLLADSALVARIKKLNRQDIDLYQRALASNPSVFYRVLKKLDTGHVPGDLIDGRRFVALSKLVAAGALTEAYTPQRTLRRPVMTKKYEPWFTDWLTANVTEETVFVDVGAGLGHFAILAGRAKTIVAVEPNPNYREVLRENVQRAGLTGVTVIENPLWSEVVRGDVIGKGRQFRVSPDGPMETTTLDALDLSPTIIKIDTEGAEYDILVGGMETLLQYSPVLLIEVHPKKLPEYGHEEEDVYQLLRGLDYEITELESCKERLWIRAIKL